MDSFPKKVEINYYLCHKTSLTFLIGLLRRLQIINILYQQVRKHNIIQPQ